MYNIFSSLTIFLLQFPEILNIHDFHIWCLTKSQVVATCHIIMSDQLSSSYPTFSKSLKQFFKNEGITLATIQPEFCSSIDDHNPSCLYKCSKDDENCKSLTCCDQEELDNEISDCTTIICNKS